jgi:archaellum component FlaC
MGFLAKSKNADLIKEDIKKKIAAGKEELKQLENKIKMIDKNF